MRKKAEYKRQIKRLFTKLRKAGGKVDLRPADDPMKQLLRGCLSTFASEARAEVALGKLIEASVDLNELRVTPIAEIVGIIGTGYPQCRAAAEEVSRGLNAVFNRVHALGLDFLMSSSRKAAEVFLSSLDGVGPYARATVMLRCLQGHVVPVDVHMHAYLQKNGCVPIGSSVEDAQKRLAGAIRERDAGSFYLLLKKFAATHAPRKPVTEASLSGKSPASKRKQAAQLKKKAAQLKKKAAKPTAKHKTTRKAAPTRSPAKKRKATAKKPTATKAAAKKTASRPSTGSKKASAGKKTKNRGAAGREAGPKKTSRTDARKAPRARSS